MGLFLLFLSKHIIFEGNKCKNIPINLILYIFIQESFNIGRFLISRCSKGQLRYIHRIYYQNKPVSKMLEPLAERLSKVSIILASGSPRRREILSTALPKLQLQREKCFHVVTSDAEEKFGLNKNDTKYGGENVWKYAVDTARLKAEDVFNRASQNTIPNLNETFMVIGSDTIVTYDGTIYGKPKDKEDANRILKELSGKTHSVISGVVILCNHTKDGSTKNKIEHQFHSVTKVQFDDLDDKVIK